MSTQDEKSGARTYFELDCSRCELTAGSISHNSSGTVYRCRCGPLAEAELVGLERAAAQGATVRFVFSHSRVAIADVAIERVTLGWVQIEGRIVDSSYANAATATTDMPAG
jgi:hypothetical protein